MAKLIILAVLFIGCANVHINRAAFAVSTLALACDAGQTYKMASHGWDGAREMNPVMGERPDRALVGAYFLTAAAANVIAWIVTPERYRAVIPSAVIGIQANAIAGNVREGTGWCGL